MPAMHMTSQFLSNIACMMPSNCLPNVLLENLASTCFLAAVPILRAASSSCSHTCGTALALNPEMLPFTPHLELAGDMDATFHARHQSYGRTLQLLPKLKLNDCTRCDSRGKICITIFTQSPPSFILQTKAHPG